MTCPRCGNEWDVSKSPCSRCGLLVRLPGYSGAARTQAPQTQQSQPGVAPVQRPSEAAFGQPGSTTIPPLSASPKPQRENPFGSSAFPPSQSERNAGGLSGPKPGSNAQFPLSSPQGYNIGELPGANTPLPPLPGPGRISSGLDFSQEQASNVSGSLGSTFPPTNRDSNPFLGGGAVPRSGSNSNLSSSQQLGGSNPANFGSRSTPSQPGSTPSQQLGGSNSGTFGARNTPSQPNLTRSQQLGGSNPGTFGARNTPSQPNLSSSQQSGGSNPGTFGTRNTPSQAGLTPSQQLGGSNPANFRSRSTPSQPGLTPSQQLGGSNPGNFGTRNTPSQTGTGFTSGARSIDNIAVPNTPRPQTPFRASRLVTDPTQERSQPPMTPLPQTPSGDPISPLPLAASEGAAAKNMLMPGTLLRGGRYRLQELQEHQEWALGVYEDTWIAQDSQRAGAPVMVCEVVMPDSTSMLGQSILRAATVALTSVGRHPRIPTLWDAFGEQGRSFFVFEPLDGESLVNHMRRTGRALPEQEVIECCLQMTEVLELLAQQSPPLVHGRIQPEHIVVSLSGDQYKLTDFSILLAGGATQYITGNDRARLTPYMAPEFSRGVIDVRSDLYSLLATAYHAVTGTMPSAIGGSATIPSARRLNPAISAEFDAILSKGLRPGANQRYQRPSELRQELLAIRSAGSNATLGNGFVLGSSLPEMPAQAPASSSLVANQGVPDSVAQMLPNLLGAGLEDDEQDRKLLLPRPEELPPLEEKNDLRASIFWLSGILVSLIVVVAIGRGLG
ncbi:hypothetical protein EPA93_43115 [Ktedonosporobacter rubrisoli]|uniref:Protein kinase domain-containing protein n=1 Tax=Ktedonosporobacter rubrisoli TaxID=2509675 RepID=A0A4P6K2G7_KTERU|nr:protein kinase [Ktedonosporobacter rubrisoli]QBD82407.1 hypothetical protein EPA93_43115 [Ktedonosporobacter rubrisoli]